MIPQVESELRVREYVVDLAASGRYHFVSREFGPALGIPTTSVHLALNRLLREKLIASPVRGFYVIVPPEYRSLGCLPAEQFIPALMKHLNLSYYVGLQSAAQYHGAAHQPSQAFQVFLAKNRRPIACGMVRVAFTARKRLTDVPVQSFITPRGTVLVSSPEATALDLIGYRDQAGGLQQVTTILSELAERIDPEKLAAAATAAPIAWAQRLGYLLEHLGFVAKTASLRSYVHEHATRRVVLLPRGRDTLSHSPRSRGWKLYVNAKVEAQSSAE